MLNSCTSLSSVLSQISKQVKEDLPDAAVQPLHDLKPGDVVVVRDLRRKHWKCKRWNGPFQVLPVTHTAVKVAERATWIHASHSKVVPALTEAPVDSHSQSG